jgi:hypothetical protein
LNYQKGFVTKPLLPLPDPRYSATAGLRIAILPW